MLKTRIGLTTTEAAVLALLAIEGERSAYDLTKIVERSIAHIWSPAKSGLYATLPRLAKDGLATKRGRLYRISRDGRAALTEWLETVEPGARDTFFLKLFVGGLTTPEVLLEHVAQFISDCEARAAAMDAIDNDGEGHNWFHAQMLEYGVERTSFELDWARRLERSLQRR